VIHDNTLDRTYGLSVTVSETDSWDLIQHGVPTLTEVLDVVKQYPATLFIEIKSESVDAILSKYGVESTYVEEDLVTLKRLLSLVAKRIDLYKEVDCVVIAFDPNIVDTYLEMFPWYEAGWCLPSYSEENVKKLSELGCEYAFVDHNDLPDTQLPGVCTWVAYEVPSKELGDSLLNRGINLLETMNVREMLESYK
jgi:hypothetical protein